MGKLNKIKMSDVLNFVNKEFSTNNHEVDFKKVQPKVYLHSKKYLLKLVLE